MNGTALASVEIYGLSSVPGLVGYHLMADLILYWLKKNLLEPIHCVDKVYPERYSLQNYLQ